MQFIHFFNALMLLAGQPATLQNFIQIRVFLFHGICDYTPYIVFSFFLEKHGAYEEHASQKSLLHRCQFNIE